MHKKHKVLTHYDHIHTSWLTATEKYLGESENLVFPGWKQP